MRFRSTAAVPITVARGDGIGPEIFDAAWSVLEAAGANLAPEVSAAPQNVWGAAAAQQAARAVLRRARHLPCGML